MTVATTRAKTPRLRKTPLAGLALFFCLLAALAALAKDRNGSAKYTLDNAVATFSAERAEKTDTGYRYWFFDPKFADGRTLKLSVVGPHQKSHPPHKHDGHEFFYVLEGKAEFFLDGKTRVVGPSTGLYCAPWSMHGIRNVGDGELKYLVIKDYVEEAGAAAR
jgi:quercetin dioxygenase-like cupin family protein